MKSLKLIDLIMQMILLPGGFIYAIINVQKGEIIPIYSYIAVGLWQVISYSIHYFFFTPTILQNDRILYGRIVLVILLLGFILFIPVLFNVSVTAPFVIIYLISLLIFSPFLAIFYLVTCWREYRIMIQRELIHLK
jgi:hypothetical protein